MKIRLDFVTNSSSSSFIVAFQNKADMERQRENMLHIYSKYIVDTIFGDIERHKVTYTQAKALVKEAVEDECYYRYRYGHRSPYQDKPYSWFDSNEYKKMIKPEIDRELERFEKSYNHRGIFAEVSYSDHTSEGSMLEHEIMPNQSFVVKSINCH